MRGKALRRLMVSGLPAKTPMTMGSRSRRYASSPSRRRANAASDSSASPRYGRCQSSATMRSLPGQVRRRDLKNMGGFSGRRWSPPFR